MTTIINNRTARIMPQDKAMQAWAPLATPEGVLLATGVRAIPCTVIRTLMDAFLAAHPAGTFAVVGHGVRAVQDGTTGQGSPFFVERRGAGTGEVYLYGAASKVDAVRAALGEGCAGVRVESKGGLYVTLNNNADVGALVSFLSLHGSVRGPVGYRADMGAPTMLDTVDAAPPAPATDAKPAKGKRAKREATA